MYINCHSGIQTDYYYEIIIILQCSRYINFFDNTHKQPHKTEYTHSKQSFHANRIGPTWIISQEGQPSTAPLWQWLLLLLLIWQIVDVLHSIPPSYLPLCSVGLKQNSFLLENWYQGYSGSGIYQMFYGRYKNKRLRVFCLIMVGIHWRCSGLWMLTFKNLLA